MDKIIADLEKAASDAESSGIDPPMIVRKLVADVRKIAADLKAAAEPPKSKRAKASD